MTPAGQKGKVMRQQAERGELVKLVLKYCEGCGTLGLRQEAGSVYCLACERRLAGQASSRGPRIPGRRI